MPPPTLNSEEPVYQRGSVINSQHVIVLLDRGFSISKGIGDQFSALRFDGVVPIQYIKGDR